MIYEFFKSLLFCRSINENVCRTISASAQISKGTWLRPVFRCWNGEKNRLCCLGVVPNSTAHLRNANIRWFHLWIGDSESTKTQFGCWIRSKTSPDRRTIDSVHGLHHWGVQFECGKLRSKSKPKWPTKQQQLDFSYFLMFNKNKLSRQYLKCLTMFI